jgi:hypothetical protein
LIIYGHTLYKDRDELAWPPVNFLLWRLTVGSHCNKPQQMIDSRQMNFRNGRQSSIVSLRETVTHELDNRTNQIGGACGLGS